MARKKKEEGGGGGAPAWMATFSDLMNLLLCFFVLLFSMSSVDANKWEQVVASMSGAFSIFKSGSTAIGDGTLVGLGTSQLNNLDEYQQSFGQESEDEGEEMRDKPEAGKDGQIPDDNSGDGQPGENPEENPDAADQSDADKKDHPADEDKKGGKTLEEQLAEASRAESEEMLDNISEMSERYSISDKISVTMDKGGKYVELTISGSLLFDSGSAELKSECLPLLSKVGDILKVYSDHDINIIGHTDNVPMKSKTYESNEMLSSARAISAAMYIVNEKNIDITRISWTGRGEYEPIASNSTAEGRARNRRVEIRIYNSYSSK